MKTIRVAAGAVLAAVFAAALWPGVWTRHSYDEQFRELPNSSASRQFPLGADELGRDRLVRTLYGTRVSLIAAVAAALVSTMLAAIVGGAAGFLGGWVDRTSVAVMDLMLSLPWLFLLIIVRAL